MSGKWLFISKPFLYARSVPKKIVMGDLAQKGIDNRLRGISGHAIAFSGWQRKAATLFLTNGRGSVL
jgi:hypothetical protein